MQYLESKQYFPMSDFSTLNEMLNRSFRNYPDQTAVTYRVRPDDEPERVTYRQMEADAHAVQQGLAQLQPGTRRIAVTGENSYHWMLTYMATVTGLGTVIPLDRLLLPAETAGLLERSEADTLVCDASMYLKLRESGELRSLSHLNQIIVMFPERLNDEDRVALGQAFAASEESLKMSLFSEVLADGQALLNSGQKIDLELPDPEESLILIFTSGTTANSKGVLLSHKSIGSNIKSLEGFVKIPERVRMLSLLPLNHAFENTCGFLFALNVGAEIYIADGLRYVQQNMKEYKIQMVIGVPAIFEAFHKRIMATVKKTGKDKKLRTGIKISRFLRKIGVDRRRKLFADIHEAFGGEFSMAIAGAAPMNLEIINFFEDIGVRIMQGYGLTETSPVVAGCNTQLFVAGTVGVGLPEVEVAIDSDTPGEPGEILVRGDLLMNGYYRDEAATQEAIDADGWFHTGDLGAIDEKTGCLTIKGRLKSLIVLDSGKKVFPEELEQLINQGGEAFVKDSLVFSQPDESGRTIITAKIVLDKEALEGQSDVRERIEQLIAEVNAQIPAFKRINTFFYTFSDMIRTTTLKVKRPAEIAAIMQTLQEHGLRLREITGRNVDELLNPPSMKSDSPGLR